MSGFHCKTKHLFSWSYIHVCLCDPIKNSFLWCSDKYCLFLSTHAGVLIALIIVSILLFIAVVAVIIMALIIVLLLKQRKLIPDKTVDTPPPSNEAANEITDTEKIELTENVA